MARVIFICAIVFLALPVFVLGQDINIKDGDLISASDSFDIYIVKLKSNKQFKRLILNPAIFNSYAHLKWENVKTVSQSTLDQYQFSDLVIEINADGSIANPKVYRVSSSQGSDVGERRWLNISASEFEEAGYDWDAIYYINHTEASPDFYPERTAYTARDIFPERYQREPAPATDVIPPIISDISALKIIANSALISWNTNENSDTLVEYGVSYDNLNLSVTGTALLAASTFNHNANLSGLTAKTKYFYKVISTDSGSNRSQGEINSFTTTDCNAEVPTSHTKIQNAIDAIKSGEKICVLSGIYQENIEINGKDIILKGAGWENTSIKSDNTSQAGGSVVTLKNTTSATVIEGFSVSDSSLNNYGILLENASPVIRNNHIKNNYAGIKIIGNSAPDINHNIFFGNNANGAIIHNGVVGGYSIDHNTFSNNGITAGVATILLDSNFPNSPITIKNNIFSGGAIGVYEANTAFNFILDYNLFYNQSESYLKRINTIYNNISGINDLSNAAKNIVGDPALELDYRPKANSPVIGVADDSLSNIGAY